MKFSLTNLIIVSVIVTGISLISHSTILCLAVGAATSFPFPILKVIKK